MFKVIFETEGGEDVTVFAVGGENVLDLARSANVPIDAPCSGNGTCGKCKVKVLEGDKEADDGWQLACGSFISSDAKFLVPDSASAYMSNITTVVMKQGDGSSASSANEAEEPSPCLFTEPSPRLSFGLAIDIGTTTVSVLLVDMTTGDILAKATTGNGQIRYGADVINRIIEQQKPGGIKKLQDAIITDTLIPLIDNICDATGVNREKITRLTVAANTTMNHLLLGVDANSIRIEPYEPTFLEFEVLDPASIGISLAPGAEMLIAPNVGSYVGGDITAGVLGTGAATSWQMWPNHGDVQLTDTVTYDGATYENIETPDKMTLLIDLGTNGEIVLSNREFMMSCACSAGPAFEGGDISCGMRATDGAVEACRINKETMEPELTVIGDGKPVGLCGSGLIDAVAELFRAGIINGKGKFNYKTGDGSLSYCPNKRIRHDEYGLGSYILAFSSESATGRDITLTEVDIDNFIRAKGAIFSGIISLLSPLGLTPVDIDDVFIAGGIGSGIDIKSAVCIGMLPDLPEEKFRYLGNTALDGAYAMLLPQHSEQSLEIVNDIARNMTYIDLSTQPGYMDEFIAACFLPHTDETLFTSYK